MPKERVGVVEGGFISDDMTSDAVVPLLITPFLRVGVNVRVSYYVEEE